MKRLYKFQVGSNEIAFVEIEEPDSGGLVRASRADREAIETSVSIENALAHALPMAKAAAGLLKEIDTGHAQAEISFGIRLTPDGEAIVTPGSEQANFRLSLRLK